MSKSIKVMNLEELSYVTGGEKVGHTGFITCPACGQQIDINNK